KPAEPSAKSSAARPTPPPREIRARASTTTTVSPNPSQSSPGGLSSSPASSTPCANRPSRQAEDSLDETNPVFSELTARNLGRRRLPTPDSASQTRASQAIAEEYKPSYDAAKTDEEKSELAKKLIQDERRTGDNAQRFVMLRIAKDIALKANDWE